MNWYKLQKTTNHLSKSSMDWRDIQKGLENGAKILIPVAAIMFLSKCMGKSPSEVNNLVQQKPADISTYIEHNIINNPKQNISHQQKSQPTTKPTDQPSRQNKDSFDSRLANLLVSHEGKRNKVYLDSMGHKTIGVGFLLDTNLKPNARSLIESVGANYNNIINGTETLSDDQIYALFNEDLQRAKADALTFIPDLQTHPEAVQMVVIDMAFNLGITKLSKFKKMRNFIITRQYKAAATAMEGSLWFSQTGYRSKELFHMLSMAK